MARKIELNRDMSEKDKINQLIDEFYVKNSKKDGEAYETVSEADWKLAWAMSRLAESQDRIKASLVKLIAYVAKLSEQNEKGEANREQGTGSGERLTWTLLASVSHPQNCES